MRKIFIISLPRHGTKSTESFLNAHGIALAHNGKLPTEKMADYVHPERMIAMHAQMARGDYKLELLEDDACAGMAMYPACSHYRQLAEQYPDALFIHIKRDKEEWLDSAEKFLAATARSREGNQPLQEAFAFFRTAAFGKNPQSRADFAAGYDRHYADVEKFGETVGKDRFLSLDMKELTQEGPALDRLCAFVGIERDPKATFPHTGDLLGARFFSARDSGKDSVFSKG